MNTNHFRRSLETFPQQTVFLLSTHRPRCTFLSHTLHNQGEQSDPTGSSSPVCIKQNNNPDKGRPAQAVTFLQVCMGGSACICFSYGSPEGRSYIHPPCHDFPVPLYTVLHRWLSICSMLMLPSQSPHFPLKQQRALFQSSLWQSRPIIKGTGALTSQILLKSVISFGGLTSFKKTQAFHRYLSLNITPHCQTYHKRNIPKAVTSTTNLHSS